MSGPTATDREALHFLAQARAVQARRPLAPIPVLAVIAGAVFLDVWAKLAPAEQGRLSLVVAALELHGGIVPSHGQRPETAEAKRINGSRADFMAATRSVDRARAELAERGMPSIADLEEMLFGTVGAAWHNLMPDEQAVVADVTAALQLHAARARANPV